MKHFYLILGVLLLSVYSTLAQPANDDCANAEVITVATTLSTVSFDINTATINNEEGCTGTTADYADVWYEFTMPVNGNLYVDGSLSWNIFALYDGCGGALIQCGASNQFFEGLTSGTNYKLRVFRTSSNAGNTAYQAFAIQAFEEVTNDDCASAETVAVSTTESTVNFEIGGATINNEEGCTGTTNDYADIWYDFTMPVDGNLYVNASINWNLIALYDACGGTQIQCGATNQLFTGLTSGTNYKLRVFRLLSNADNNSYKLFTIQAFEEVANDDCASAETITVSTAASTVNFEIGGATITNEEGCTGTTNDYADIWYDFAMPVDGNLYVDGFINWNIIALYDSCGGTQIQCGASNQLFTGLTSGTNYKLRIFRLLSNVDNSGYKSFSVQAFEAATNDDCSSAETIAISTTESTVNFEIGGATINNEEGCIGTTNDYADIWYDFTMPVNGNLSVNGSINWNILALYDSCGGTQIQCGASNQSFTGLLSGANYKLRVFRLLSNADNSSYKSFTVQAFETFNDDCASALTIPVSTTQSTVNFDIGGASVNNEEGCTGATDDYSDVWYELTMPVDGNLFVDGAISWNNFALYDSCGGTQIQCGATDQLFEGLTNGTNYKLRVFRTSALASNTTYLSFTVQAFENVTNDDCASAETLAVSATPSVVNFEIAGAAINNEIGCGTSVSDYVDVWYDFTMPYDGSISVDGSVNFNYFALYDACGGTQLDCFFNNGTFSGLTNGSSYKLRVFRDLFYATNNTYKSFTIQTTETLGTEENQLSQVKIYPNPAKNTLYIDSANAPLKSITIYDYNGRVLIKQDFSETVDLSNLNIGLYFVNLTSNNASKIQKLIIE